MTKIKILKGIEKACLVGAFLVGTPLIVVGGIRKYTDFENKSNNIIYIGGIITASAFIGYEKASKKRYNLEKESVTN